MVAVNDFFFLKNEIIVKDLALTDAQIYLRRHKQTDLWNYQFLIDKFGSNNESKSSSNGPQIQLQHLQLGNVKFSFVDEWVGTDYYATVGDLVVVGDGIDYDSKIINIKSVNIAATTFGILEYTGGRPPRVRKKRDLNEISGTPFNINGWQLSVQDLNIQKGAFYLEYPEDQPHPHFFDEQHINITNINTKIASINIVGDTITADVKQLNATERCGLAIREFKSKIKISPNISECNHLYLKTNHSEIKDYYAMHYRHFPDFLDYINKVKMVGNFEKSKVGINDILYFTDEITRIKDKQFELTGLAQGTVNNLYSEQIELNDRYNFYKGDFGIYGIPNTDEMTIVVNKATINGTGSQTLQYLPELKNSDNVNIASIGEFAIQASFAGKIDDFKSEVNITSSIGGASANMHILNATKGDRISYKGTVITDMLNIGALTNNSNWQDLSMKTEVSATGMEFSAVDNVELNIQIDNLQFNNYDYKNIALNGVYKNEIFEGNALFKDEHLNGYIENGKLFFRNNKAVYNLDATIHHINTKELGWTNHNLSGQAEVNLNFTGTSLDDFLGSVLVYNMKMKVDNDTINLNQFYLSATESQQQKTLNFLTNGIDGRISGNYDLSTMPSALRRYFSKYFPAYLIKDSIASNSLQKFSFQVTTKQTDDFLKFINVDASLGAGTNLLGHFDNEKDELTIQGNIPYLNYQSVNFKNGTINILGNAEGLKQNITLNNFSYDDYEIATLLHLDANIIDNNGVFKLTTESINTLGNAEIAGTIAGRNDSFYINIAPSTALFNHKKWFINSPNTIVVAPNYLDITGVELNSDKQKISINGNGQNSNNLFITMKDVEVNPINNLLHFTDFYMNGKMEGNLHVKDVFFSQDIDYVFTIDTLYVDQIKYGHLYAKGTANLNKSTVVILPSSTLYSDWGKMNFDLIANYDKDNSSIKGKAVIDNAPLTFIYPFIKNHIELPTGNFSAQIELSGDLYRPEYWGYIDLKDVAVKPLLTGVTYYIDNNRALLKQGTFVFDNFVVRDALYQKGLLNGTVKSEGWDNYLFDLTLNSEKLQVLNLDKYDNSYYYGNITAAATVNLNGRWNNLRMNVVGKPLANAQLNIPISSGGDYSTYEYITFKKPNTTKLQQAIPEFNYNLRIDAIATNDLEVNIILDESTGDKLQAKGSGNVILDMPSNGEMTLTGNYIIEEGSYNFAFKQLEVLNYRKNFILESGSMIKWSGNPYDADLSVKANTQVKARLYDLIMNESDRIGLNTQEITDAQLPQMINIHLDMNGALSKPQLSFKLDLVENRSVGTYAYQKLQRINTNERELLNQVSGLLLLNQFLPPDGLNNSSISAGAITNMSELLSSTASSQISNFANKLLGIEDLMINLKYKNYALSGVDPNNPASYLNRNEAGLNVRKNFFNDRLVTEVGGIYDWGNRNTNYNLAGEFRVQYLLTKDGRIRFNAFRTSNYDAIVQQNIARQGGGLLFKKSFSNLSEFFDFKSKNNFNNSDSFKTINSNLDTTKNNESSHIN